VNATIKLPDTISVALVASPSTKLDIMADYTYTGWDKIQDLTINRDGGGVLSTVPLTFQNTYRVGLGATYGWSEKMKLRLGTAYDKSPVQDEFRTPRLPDGDRVWASLGLQFKAGKGAVDVGYAHLFVSEPTS